MIGEDALLLFADRLAGIDGSLEQAGFTSCLVDRDWMRSHPNADEWRDLLVYKGEYAREVMLSSEPAKIERSNPGDYRWRSSDIAERVLRRFRESGDVDTVFQDPWRRHLMALTIPAQRLRKSLERASAADIQACEQRFEEFHRRYARVLQQARNSDVLVQEMYEDPSATWASVQRLFVRLVSGRVLGQMRSPTRTSIRLAPKTDQTGEYVELQMEVDPESLTLARRGAMYMTADYRPGPTASAPCRIRRLHILPLLPNQFRNYLRFASRDEFVLCFAAWLHVAT